jgi:PPE-repeat protein
MNFGVLPPEINSGRMYAGPGSGPLMAAAAAWDEIAAALATAASGYGLVIAELTAGPWVGSASSSMVSAVLPYVGWLGAVAGSAEETASQGRAAAAAFEAAFAMTAPPAIAANRVLLATLIATNFFGQNTPAIMATEAQYAEMWAQDAAAMYGYAAASATASELAPFASPPNTSTPDGVTGQALALTQALQQPAGNSAQTAASTIFQLTAATATTSSQPKPFTWLTNAIRDFLQYAPPAPANNYLGLAPSMYTAVLKQTTGLAYFSNGLSNFGMSIAQQLTTGPGGATVGAGGAWFPTPQFAQLGLGNLGNVGTASSVMAGAGQAAHVGALSVPQQWATLTSGVSPDNAVEGEAIPVRAAGAMTNAPGNALLGGMPTGGSVRRTASVGYSHKYGFRYSVLTRPPSAG